MEKLSFGQKLVLFLAKRTGLKVDLSNREILKPEVKKKDAQMIGQLEAKVQEQSSKIKEMEKKKPVAPKKDPVLDVFKPENVKPMGKIKYIQGIDGMIGTLKACYIEYKDGYERVWFVVNIGRKEAYFGGKSLRDTLAEPTLDTNKTILYVRFNRKGEYVPKKDVSVDLMPNTLKDADIMQATSLLKSLGAIMSQNVELKRQISTVLPAQLASLKKEYAEIYDSALSDINKQKEQILKFQEEKKALIDEIEALKKKTQEEANKNKEIKDKLELARRDIYDIGGVDGQTK